MTTEKSPQHRKAIFGRTPAKPENIIHRLAAFAEGYRRMTEKYAMISAGATEKELGPLAYPEDTDQNIHLCSIGVLFATNLYNYETMGQSERALVVAWEKIFRALLFAFTDDVFVGYELVDDGT